jgi:hypothetical protein
LVIQAMLIAYRMNAPDQVIQLFEDYLAHCKTLIEGNQPPAPVNVAPAALNANAANAAQMAAAMPQPGAAPMPMPVAA